MEKKIYESAEMEIIELEVEEIDITSGPSIETPIVPGP